MDHMQFDFRVGDTSAPQGERGLYRARIDRGDFALGAGVRVVDHHRRLLDRPVFAKGQRKIDPILLLNTSKLPGPPCGHRAKHLRRWNRYGSRRR